MSETGAARPRRQTVRQRGEHASQPQRVVARHFVGVREDVLPHAADPGAAEEPPAAPPQLAAEPAARRHQGKTGRVGGEGVGDDEVVLAKRQSAEPGRGVIQVLFVRRAVGTVVKDRVVRVRLRPRLRRKSFKGVVFEPVGEDDNPPRPEIAKIPRHRPLQLFARSDQMPEGLRLQVGEMLPPAGAIGQRPPAFVIETDCVEPVAVIPFRRGGETNELHRNLSSSISFSNKAGVVNGGPALYPIARTDADCSR